MIKRIISFSKHFLFEYIISIYLFPFALSLITVLFGFVEQQSLFYIWIGFLASLAFGFHWWIKFYEWKYKIMVENKLIFSNLSVKNLITENGILEGVAVRLTMSSIADFPIDFRVEDLFFKLENIVPSETHETKDTYNIPIRGVGWYDSDIIEIQESFKSKAVAGEFNFSVLYGRKGDKLKYKLSQKKKIFITFNPEGFALQIIWSDIV